MSNAPEDFEKLQKLLKWKRHEQPPPGYFNNFSTRVVSGIRISNTRDAAWGQAPWLKRLINLLETNPIAAGLFGMSICGLLISGIVYSQYRTPSEYSTDNVAAGVDLAAATTPQWGQSVRVDSTMPSINSVFNTNAAGGALFGNLGKLSVQQVNFNP